VRESCTAAEPLLSAWLDDAVDPAERAVVETHLRGCPACRRVADETAATRALLRSLPVRRAPRALRTRLATPPAPDPSALRGTIRLRNPAGWPGGSGGRLARFGVAATLAAGLLSAAAFSVGDRPTPDTRLVSVPVDRYAADHLARTVDEPLFAPVLQRGGP
jgi:anti-sigma factor RsiW